MAIAYTRTFTHADWIDNEDVVQAGGEKGFNARFHGIEDEFNKISAVVSQLNAALASLGAAVTAPITISLVPMMLPWGGTPAWSATAWSRVVANQTQGTFVEKPVANDQAWGLIALALPHGATLLELKVLGEQVGNGDVTTDLYKESRIAPYTRTSLISVQGLTTPAGAATPINGTPKFDAAESIYYLLVRVQNAAGSTVHFRGCQLKYQV
jgi:hypothetical protein